MTKQQSSNVCTLIGNVCVDTSHYDMLVLPMDITIAPLGVKNGNGQAIPLSEKDNIMQSAAFMPVLANFHNGLLFNHAGAVSVGGIREVYITDDNVIKARAYIWRQYNTDLVEYLEDEKQVQCSWEILHDSSYTANDTEYLTGCVITGICLVSNPAYRTLTPATIATAQQHSPAQIASAFRELVRRR